MEYHRIMGDQCHVMRAHYTIDQNTQARKKGLFSTPKFSEPNAVYMDMTLLKK